MLNKIFISLFILAVSLAAQDFNGTRIYINPGHGGNDSDDRFIPQTGFWESEGNLSKGLYLRDILDSLNATTKMSRTTNNSSDDLGLSVIAADANNFDADFFHSIHSNGFRGTANYTLMLYKETNGSPAFPEAKQMSDIMANTIFQVRRTTAKYSRGDMSFLGFNLGVLRTLTMPGTLSEGSFHDYIPESWRLKNEAYLKHEAWAIAKAFINYFELETFPFGEIAGILRDPYDDVDYYFIPGTNDRRKPLNFIKALLMPDSLVYTGDDFNNGFYLFDELSPGNYDLILEAENYERDTVYSVTVNANGTTFIDRNLEPEPDFSVPEITQYSPSGAENVRLNSDIILEFSVKMDRASVEESFSITPQTAGSFSWESNDRRMIFSPDDFLEPGTTYEISLSLWAKSAFDVFVDEAFSHTFSTRSSINLLSTYPQQNSTDISTTVKIIIQFDAPINNNSLGGNIYLEDLEGNNISPLIEETDYENGRIIFGPLTTLENNSFYQIRLGDGIQDIEGSNFNKDTVIIFQTEPLTIVEGSIINDFEETGVWWQPAQSGSTNGIDPDNTSFIISSKKSVAGSSSGRLLYGFVEDSLGVCRVYNQLEPALGNTQSQFFGMWVFGDLSYNNLEYWFRDSGGNNIPLVVDTIDWTGWKFKELDLSLYNNLNFHSIVISQNRGAEKSGQIYFDAVQSDVITDIGSLNSSLPSQFELLQNYPNPFNPSTVISYSVPDQSNLSGSGNAEVLLRVFDILGREVAVLVNEKQKPGIYKAVFDASAGYYGQGISSGIYFYQIKVNDLVETKKMTLLK